MAIPFLNNIDLSDNQLLNAKLQITGTAPAAEQGQVYFNSAAGFLKPRVYDGAAWLNILDTTSVISGTYVSSTVTSDVDLTLDLSAVDGTSTAASRFLTKDNEWATIPFGDVTEVQGGTNINVTDQTGPIPIVNLDDSIDLAGELTVSGTGQSSVAGQLTIPQVPSADTDAASKHYVDQAVTGALSYQGGYDAATNTPDLDSSPSSAIKTGWTYTVTVEGLFFTEQVRVGDVLIANNNAPTTLAEWTTVQNNIDLADASTVGIGNVVPGASNTITAPYTNGTATLDVVDSTAAQKGAVIVSAGTGISVAYVAGEATVTNTETNSDNSFSGTIGDGSLTSLPITAATHGLGSVSSSFMIQLVEVSSGETVYADVTRGASGLVTIDFAVAPATNAIRVLIQKIG